MAAYRIRFMKRLNARRERAAEPCVWSVNIRIARDAIRAVSAAKRRFERLSGVANWRLKADYVNVEARPPSGNEAQDVGSMAGISGVPNGHNAEERCSGRPGINPRVARRTEERGGGRAQAHRLTSRTSRAMPAATIQPATSAGSSDRTGPRIEPPSPPPSETVCRWHRSRTAWRSAGRRLDRWCAYRKSDPGWHRRSNAVALPG